MSNFKKGNLAELKVEIDGSTIKTKHFHVSLSIMTRTTKQKIYKNPEYLISTVQTLDPRDLCNKNIQHQV